MASDTHDVGLVGAAPLGQLMLMMLAMLTAQDVGQVGAAPQKEWAS